MINCRRQVGLATREISRSASEIVLGGIYKANTRRPPRGVLRETQTGFHVAGVSHEFILGSPRCLVLGPPSLRLFLWGCKEGFGISGWGRIKGRRAWLHARRAWLHVGARQGTTSLLSAFSFVPRVGALPVTRFKFYSIPHAACVCFALFPASFCSRQKNGCG